MRQLLLLSDDHFLCEVLGRYLRRDGIEVAAVASPANAAQRVAGGAAGVVVDLAKRGLAGADIIALSQRAERAHIPLLVISSQSRREVSEFAAVVRAADVMSKSEPMTSIAARLRLWLNTKRHELVAQEPDNGFEIAELAVAT
ncbi:MAG TPA: hypothetical protein VLU46_09520 [Thermoanaerobaculia bacterium]|nr:hypothetical protein [Thermoanaerobaculia bacterium]